MKGVKEKTLQFPSFEDIAHPVVEHVRPSLQRGTPPSGMGPDDVCRVRWSGPNPRLLLKAKNTVLLSLWSAATPELGLLKQWFSGDIVP